MNPLPPQAYTKETLLKAYHWIQSQPPSIREMALTPDILVSLYLKASRDGDQSLERPSIQNFKAELRNLAGLMGELDGPSHKAGAPTQTPGVDMPPPSMKATVPTPPTAEVPPAPVFNEQPETPPAVVPPVAAMPTPPPATSASAPAAPMVEKTTHGFFQLDERSMECLREVRKDFNLTSDHEALRMLIQIGSTKAKALLKS